MPYAHRDSASLMLTEVRFSADNDHTGSVYLMLTIGSVYLTLTRGSVSLTFTGVRFSAAKAQRFSAKRPLI